MTLTLFYETGLRKVRGGCIEGCGDAYKSFPGSVLKSLARDTYSATQKDNWLWFGRNYIYLYKQIYTKTMTGLNRFLMTAFLAALPLFAQAQSQMDKELLLNEIEQDLTENILPFWMEKAVDPEGGFHGMVSYTSESVEGAPKGGVLNARILWTFSQAYGIYGLEEYRTMADRAQREFIDRFIDPVYGGVYWQIAPDGSIYDGTKQTYCLAYGIYGLSEHFRVTGNEESLEAAIGLFRTLEDIVHDKEKGGYIETFSREWKEPQAKGVDGKEGATKTMNTHIHVLEAYTSLYRVWPDAQVKSCIIELIDILQTKLYDPKTHHLILFCDNDWTPLEEIHSYGHDIETSWLLSEAAEAVGDKAIIEEIDRQAVEMTDTALAEGLNGDGAMIYEKNAEGYHRYLSWWPQCETIIGCLNAWEITGEKKYFDAAQRTWKYVQTHFIDKMNGGWFKRLDALGHPSFREPKISEWNCPYHNSRVGFEALKRLAPQRVHTEVMAWSNITGVRMDGELVDFESTLRVGRLDGYMEQTGRERQNNVRYHREGAAQIVNIPLHGAHFTQKVTDIDHNTVNLEWTAEADETLDEGAYFCITFTGRNYTDASFRIKGRDICIESATRKVSLKFNKNIKAFTRKEGEGTTVYMTLMPTLRKGRKAELSAVMTTDCVRRDEKAAISLDLGKPGNAFIGFGGNFRLQNPKNDPAVISYCLDNMRVAMGRVELPWRHWHPEEDMDPTEADLHPHVKQSLEMAQRLEAMGMPVALACWFPPQWALEPGSVRRSGGVAALRLDPQKKESIYKSLCSYIRYAKDRYGVEFDYFSFNESDIGIDVLHTAQEHAEFIKEFGAVLAAEGLPCKMFLGDNSDATTIDFIKPALADPETHKYIGAVSFHSWRGCDDRTLREWAQAAESINVPLIVGEGSTDAAAHRYPMIFNESTFALYEINLYTRICAICQPLTILQWQLTSDYSPLWGDGIYRSEGPMRPTQRFWNLRQLAMTTENSFSIPVECDKDNINTAAFANIARNEATVHIVNNGAACEATVSGLSEDARRALVFVTNAEDNSLAKALTPSRGSLTLTLPAESFITIIIK